MTASAGNLGFDDTPILPGTPYHVHDGNRPQPRVVRPGEPCSDQPVAPPSDAVVLFDGTDLSGWMTRDGGEPGWKVEHGYMEIVPSSGSIQTKEHFGDCQLHVEFACPTEVERESQFRGNSGVFMMARYEIQVLDCYDRLIYADGVIGGMYGQVPPLVNACREPGAWQTFDVIWEGPRFDGDTLLRPAFVTVLLNGIVVHHRTELRGPTAYKVLTEYEPHPEVGPLELQDHGDRVRFRNIWYRPLTGYDEG